MADRFSGVFFKLFFSTVSVCVQQSLALHGLIFHCEILIKRDFQVFGSLLVYLGITVDVSIYIWLRYSLGTTSFSSLFLLLLFFSSSFKLYSLPKRTLSSKIISVLLSEWHLRSDSLPSSPFSIVYECVKRVKILYNLAPSRTPSTTPITIFFIFKIKHNSALGCRMIT